MNQSGDIARKVKEDLGITIEYIPVVTDEVTKRAVTQPNSFDLIDTEFFSLKKIVPSGNILGMDARRIKNADKITPIFTKGEIAGKAPKVLTIRTNTTNPAALEPTDKKAVIGVGAPW